MSALRNSGRGPRTPRSTALAAVLVALAFASGCGSDADAGPSRAADGFETAVTNGDGAAACGLLTDAAVHELESSSGQPCDKAILDEVRSAGSRLDVRRYGTMAQVRYRSDVLFMAQAPDGWRVFAAACQATPGGRPYDCGIAGG